MIKNLEKLLKEKIDGNEIVFNKLESNDPYYFDRIGKDKYGNVCLYYWFWDKTHNRKNKKRVVISEIENLIKSCLSKECIRNIDYKEHCPVTATPGSCGFSVIVRILEAFNLGRYLSRKEGFKFINKNLAESLLNFGSC